MSDTRYDIIFDIYGAVLDSIEYSEALNPEDKSLIKRLRRYDPDPTVTRNMTHGLLEWDKDPAFSDLPCLDVDVSGGTIEIYTNQEARDNVRFDFRLWTDTAGMKQATNLYMRCLAALETVKVNGSNGKTFLEDVAGFRASLVPGSWRTTKKKLNGGGQDVRVTEWVVVVPMKYNQFRSTRRV